MKRSLLSIHYFLLCFIYVIVYVTTIILQKQSPPNVGYIQKNNHSCISDNRAIYNLFICECVCFTMIVIPCSPFTSYSS